MFSSMFSLSFLFLTLGSVVCDVSSSSGPGSVPLLSFNFTTLNFHNNLQSCWIAVQGTIYDCTNYLPTHPAGQFTFLPWCGLDATTAFTSVTAHSLSGLLTSCTAQGSYLSGPGSGAPPALGLVTWSNVTTHRKAATSCYVVFFHNVFDATKFVPTHPAGADVFKPWCGQDGTNAFTNVPLHDGTALLENMILLGQLSKINNTDPNLPVVPLSAVTPHNTALDCFLILSYNVFNCTGYVYSHPAGPFVFAAWCGLDATAAFNNRPEHDSNGISPKRCTLVGALLYANQTTALQSRLAPVAWSSVTTANTVSPCKTVFFYNVFDMTNFLTSNAHPPGPNFLYPWCGFDATNAFTNIANHDGTALDENLVLLGPLAYNNTDVPLLPILYSTVALHNTFASCWIIIFNNVFDATGLFKSHPAGPTMLYPWCGLDATNAFLNIPAHDPTAILEKVTALLGPLSTVNNTAKQYSTLFYQNITTHNNLLDCFVIIDRNVFNCTSYVSVHPGGPFVFLPYCGLDATAAFNNVAQHDVTAINENCLLVAAQNAATTSTSLAPIANTTISIHNASSSCWIVFYGNAYDATAYLNVHPGGATVMIPWCGRDGTAAFIAGSPQHDATALTENTILLGALSLAASAPTNTTTGGGTPAPNNNNNNNNNNNGAGVAAAGAPAQPTTVSTGVIVAIIVAAVLFIVVGVVLCCVSNMKLKKMTLNAMSKQ